MKCDVEKIFLAGRMYARDAVELSALQDAVVDATQSSVTFRDEHVSTR